MGFGFRFDFDKNAFSRVQLVAEQIIERAANATIKEAADLALQAGRGSLQAGGFPPGSLRADVYPGGGLTAAAEIYDKIPWLGVFETGGTITGKPLLWIPLKSAPTGRGGKHLAPSELIAAGQKLISINHGGHPLIGVMVKDWKSAGPWGRPKFSPKQIRRGGYKRGAPRFLPLYVGVPSVQDPKRIDVIAAVEAVAAQIPELFAKHFEE